MHKFFQEVVENYLEVLKSEGRGVKTKYKICWTFQ